VKVSEYKGYTVYADGSVYRNERVLTRSDGVSRRHKGGWVATRTRNTDKGKGGGYVFIDLYVESPAGNKVEHWLLHRLIATLFIGAQADKEVNHIDGNRTNNALSNLEWVSHSENQMHAYRTGVRKDVGENNRRSKLTNSQVAQLRYRRNVLNERLTDLAKAFGISFQSVSRIAKGYSYAII